MRAFPRRRRRGRDIVRPHPRQRSGGQRHPRPGRHRPHRAATVGPSRLPVSGGVPLRGRTGGPIRHDRHRARREGQGEAGAAPARHRIRRGAQGAPRARDQGRRRRVRRRHPRAHGRHRLLAVRGSRDLRGCRRGADRVVGGHRQAVPQLGNSAERHVRRRHDGREFPGDASSRTSCRSRRGR